MKTLRDLLEKDVDRNIDGVIKADDDRRLLTEVEEYVITSEIRPKMEDLLEEYAKPDSSKGVWISGFFGSGKSHLLKILALLLENRELDGKTVCEHFLGKKELEDDALFRSTMEKACAIPGKSLLFNIDQKADAVGGDKDAALLEVFAKVLNEAQGFYAKQDYIAQFERGLAEKGELEDFKAAYAAESGASWEKHLDDIDTIENETFARVYAAFFDKSEDEGLKLFDRLREKHRLSVDEFGNRVMSYLHTLPEGTRINFFVDEVGQFIGRNPKLMLNLQTIAETLTAKCDGRAWIFVTSQGDLKTVLGAFDETRGSEISKIQGRYEIQPNLTSANVSEVIQKRLLAKKEAAEAVLHELYEKERENLRTLFAFGDGSREFDGFRDAEHFAQYTPFHPYQFDLFQTAIERLSEHDAFTGKHASVGERSMLSVFQDVAKGIADQPINTFATFDCMFDGLSNVIRGDFQRSVQTANNSLKADHPMAARIIKALFLLKYVSEFKSTPRNVAILLIDRANIDIAAHEKWVKEELNHLYSQHYLQKNGDAYEFLTNEEKDIEVEINNTQVDDSAVNKLLDGTFFSDILRDSKIRFEDNKQDYPFGRRLDGADFGREQDLTVHLVTAGHDNAGDLLTLMAQNTGLRELLVVLPNDRSLLEDARLFEQTTTYIRQKSSAGLSDAKRQILHSRGAQNATRRSQLTQKAKDLLSEASFVINGSRVEIGGGDPRNRVSKAFQELIRFVYPNLRMLTANYKDTMIPQILEEENDLISEKMSEAEDEVLTFLQRAKMASSREQIEDALKHFRKGTYGWPDAATLCLLARLFRRHKVEFKKGPEVLDREEVGTALCNSANHGSTFVQIQEEFDATTVSAVKNFHHDFFHQANPESDAKSAAQTLLKALGKEAAELDTLVAQKSDFPFVEALAPIRDRIRNISEHDYTYPLKSIREFDKDLLTANEDLIDPIKSFIRGPHGASYQDITRFLRDQAGNLDHSNEHVTILKELVSSPEPYRGGLMSKAITAQQKLAKELTALLEEQRARALAEVEQCEALVKSQEGFASLEPAAAETILEVSKRLKERIKKETLIPVITTLLRDYRERDFPRQLEEAGKQRFKYPDKSAKGDGGENPQVKEPTPTYTSLNALIKGAAEGKIMLSTPEEATSFLEALSKAVHDHVGDNKGITI
jgi:hypothetical protein